MGVLQTGCCQLTVCVFVSSWDCCLSRALRVAVYQSHLALSVDGSMNLQGPRNHPATAVRVLALEMVCILAEFIRLYHTHSFKLFKLKHFDLIPHPSSSV